MAALPPVGSLADTDVADEAAPPAEPNVTELVYSDERSDEEAEEIKRLAEALVAGAATEGGDRAEQPESPAARERRLRREQRFIMRTMRICRDG